MTGLRNFDSAVAQPIARLPAQLKSPFHWLGNASVPLVWGLVMVVFISIERPQGFSDSMAVLAFVPLATVSKFLFRRQRPPTIYAGSMRIKSYSFPSSHSYAAALCSSFLGFTLPILALPLGILALVIGISRVYLGAHYPSDVVAGWLLGILISGGIAWL